MKKTVSFILAGLTIAFAACSKQQTAPDEAATCGTISVSVAPQDGIQTKAVTAYTTAQTYETQVNSVQVFVFGADGKINFYKNLGTQLSGSVSTTSGTKTVYAVVNGPDLSGVATISALEATAIDLSANSTTASKGFVMAGKGSCTVSAGTVSCAVAVSRLAARVALRSVINKLPESYGSLKVERVFLSNVAGNQNLGGSATVSTWYNKEGRKDESPLVQSHIIDGSADTASGPERTFRAVGSTGANGGTLEPSTPFLFYGYANSSTAAPRGFSASFSPQRSVLVVAATIDGRLYYYPVVLDNATIERNTTYTVGLTVTSLGSDDPNKPVDKGSADITVSVDGWKAGATYDETI